MSAGRLQLVEAHRRAGLLDAPEIQLASSLLRIAGDEDPKVMLAAAWALRSVRHGHICLDLQAWRTSAQGSEAQAHEQLTQQELPWPTLEQWRSALEPSTLVRSANETSNSPLVLDGSCLYLDRYFRYQSRLVDALTARSRVERKLDAKAVHDAVTRNFGDPEGRELDRQRLAAAATLFRSLALVVGGPGTGKTTTVRRLLLCAFDLATGEGRPAPRVALAAPTGKAASRLKASLVGDETGPLSGLNAQTIHRLLGRKPGNETRFRFGREQPLPYDIVVVDEASMIDLALMTKLVEAIREDATLVLLGDPDQLASVEAGAVLGDICGPRDGALRLSTDFATKLAPLVGAEAEALHADRTSSDSGHLLADCVFELTKVHRFDAGGGVGRLAKLLQRHDAASSSEALGSLRASRQAAQTSDELQWLDEDPRTSDPLREQILAGYRPAVERALEAPQAATREAGPLDSQREQEHARATLEAFDRIRVLCAHNRGPRGVEGMEQQIRTWLNEAIPDFDGAKVGLVPGLPVLITKNDAALGLFNGDIGVCLAHPLDRRRLRVAFFHEDGHVRFVSPTRLPAHRSVLAMSIHKSQGSQFEHVVVLLPKEASPICTRELVYTAITRARKRATLVSSEAVLRECLSQRVHRASGLAAALRDDS